MCVLGGGEGWIRGVWKQCIPLSAFAPSWLLWGGPPGHPGRAPFPSSQDPWLSISRNAAAFPTLPLSWTAPPASGRSQHQVAVWLCERIHAGQDLHLQTVDQAHPSPLHPSPCWDQKQGADRGGGDPAGAVPVPRSLRMLLRPLQPQPESGPRPVWQPCRSNLWVNSSLLLLFFSFSLLFNCCILEFFSTSICIPFPAARHASSLSKRLCKSGEEVNTEGLESSLLQLQADSIDRSQNVWQWILESDRQTKHKPHRSVSQLCGHAYIVISENSCACAFAHQFSFCYRIAQEF